MLIWVPCSPKAKWTTRYSIQRIVSTCLVLVCAPPAARSVDKPSVVMTALFVGGLG